MLGGLDLSYAGLQKMAEMPPQGGYILIKFRQIASVAVAGKLEGGISSP
jgi:hypothetical protein